MKKAKKLCFLVVLLTAAFISPISCDMEESYDSYVDKIAIPKVGELPDFTADMGIPVRDSIDAELFLDSLLKFGAGEIFAIFDYSIQSGIYEVANKKYQGSHAYKLKNEQVSIIGNFYDLDIIEYQYCVTKLHHISENWGRKTIETFSRVKLGYSSDEFTDFAVHKGSIRNLWTRSGGEDVSFTEVLVKRFACAYIMSLNGFCAKLVVDYIYFRNEEYPSECTIRVYGANNQELLVRKIKKHFDIYKFIDADTYNDFFEHNF